MFSEVKEEAWYSGRLYKIDQEASFKQVFSINRGLNNENNSNDFFEGSKI